MMKFQTVKKDEEVALYGVQFHIERHDNSIKSVTLLDSKGDIVKIDYTGYSISILIPAKTMVKKYVLTGNLFGLPVHQVFDTWTEADNRKAEIENGIVGPWDGKIEEIEVPEEGA